MGKNLPLWIYTLFIIDLIILLVVLLFGENLFLYFFGDKIDASLMPIVFMTLMFLISMIFGKTLGQILHNLLLSMKLEKSITIYDTIVFTISLLLKIILTYNFSIIGFLLGAVLSSVLKLVTKFYLFSIKIKKFEKKEYYYDH